jgi:hypothetical protein
MSNLLGPSGQRGLSSSSCNIAGTNGHQPTRARWSRSRKSKGASSRRIEGTRIHERMPSRESWWWQISDRCRRTYRSRLNVLAFPMQLMTGMTGHLMFGVWKTGNPGSAVSTAPRPSHPHQLYRAKHHQIKDFELRNSRNYCLQRRLQRAPALS